MKDFRVGVIGATGMVGQRLSPCWNIIPGFTWPL